MGVVNQVNNYDCSVVVVNVIEHFLDLCTPLWLPLQSELYHQVWFFECVHEHLQQSHIIRAISYNYSPTPPDADSYDVIDVRL